MTPKAKRPQNSRLSETGSFGMPIKGVSDQDVSNSLITNYLATELQLEHHS